MRRHHTHQGVAKMVTLYRIVDPKGDTYANGLSEYSHAQETLEFLQRDYPQTKFEIESYTHYNIKGLGRDPDLH